MSPEPAPQAATSAAVPSARWATTAATVEAPLASATLDPTADGASERSPRRARREAKVVDQRPIRRGRRVKRVVRRVELWSVLKLALIFYLCMYVVVMATLVVVWGFAHSTGLVDNFESFANDVGWENWQFYGEDMFREAAVIGGILAITATVLTVLAAALINVISELTGGIRIVVIEEELVPAPVVAVPSDPTPGPRRRRSRQRSD